ncbi:MAG: permease [Verrucomicrobiales bacterium]|nr:permease [Verrucomicrobiales bacterium]
MSSSCCGHTPPPPPEPESRPSCCGGGSTPEPAPSCCGAPAAKRRIDWLLWGSAALLLPAYLWHALGSGSGTGHVHGGAGGWLTMFSGGAFELLNRMWWGLLAGIVAVGLIARVPREFVLGVLGQGGSFTGLLRATAAGTLLDLCSHGILLVGTQLYRRGASLGQTVAFLIASPWNSLSLTLILISLIGLGWTLAFVGLSMVVALLGGWLMERFVASGVLPENPHRIDLPEGFRFFPEARRRLRETRFDGAFFLGVLRQGFAESGMILRWIFFGTVLAAAIRASVPETAFAAWFGPTLAGLGLTLVATTIIEVCSEGSSPIAADLLTRGAAPGNGFAFLMAGVATDYTEILSLRETTRSWKAALFLPLVTVPQVLVIGWLLNRGWGG